jgi:DNA-binding NtrC family response regulator
MPIDAADEPEAHVLQHWPHASLLVVDDEVGMCSFLERALGPCLGHVEVAESAEQAGALLQRHRFDLLIVDVALPGRSGIDLLREVRAQGSSCEVILITAFADLDTAIEALRAGASDFLLKPFRVTQVLNAVQRALERAQLRRENWVLRRRLSQRELAPDRLVGDSIVIKGLQSAIQRVAAVGSTVLLTGESGTGKELAALALHRYSPRASAPFVPVNCASMSASHIEAELFGHGGRSEQRDGLFIYAQGGTLFLDEVSELPLALQAGFLRVLEDRHIRPVGSEYEIPVDVRIIAATNRPLREDVAAGRFRKDLYYRLQVVEIELPPLRAHKEDIPALVAHFIETLAPQLGVPPIVLTPDELRHLAEYDWPGNVRELRNLIERSLIVGGLNVSALYQGLSRMAGAPRWSEQVGGPADMQTLEKRHILAVLHSVGGDRGRAAQILGISRRTIERRCAEWPETSGQAS